MPPASALMGCNLNPEQLQTELCSKHKAALTELLYNALAQQAATHAGAGRESMLLMSSELIGCHCSLNYRTQNIPLALCSCEMMICALSPFTTLHECFRTTQLNDKGILLDN